MPPLTRCLVPLSRMLECVLGSVLYEPVLSYLGFERVHTQETEIDQRAPTNIVACDLTRDGTSRHPQQRSSTAL